MSGDAWYMPLQWRNVDFAPREVRLDANSTKNDDGRVSPFALMPVLQTLLEDQWVEHKRLVAKKRKLCPYVFNRAGHRILTFKKAWRQTCIDAGCPGRIPHDFRRTAVRNLVRAGIAERVAMEMTGHLTRSVFDRYNIVNERELFSAGEQLVAYLRTCTNSARRIPTLPKG